MSMKLTIHENHAKKYKKKIGKKIKGVVRETLTENECLTPSSRDPSQTQGQMGAGETLNGREKMARIMSLRMG